MLYYYKYLQIIAMETLCEFSGLSQSMSEIEGILVALGFPKASLLGSLLESTIYPLLLFNLSGC